MNQGKAQQSSFGFQAGATFASYKVRVDNISATSKTKLGFTAGVTGDIDMGKNFSFQPGLNFLQKGGVEKNNSNSNEIKTTTNLNYLELPLNIVYNAKSISGKFFVGAGPSLSMGLSGKGKVSGSGIDETDKIKFGSSDDDDFKALELGVNFLAGYQFKSGVFLAANYNAGVSNLFNTTGDDNSKYHNRHFAFRIGYMLQGAKKK